MAPRRRPRPGLTLIEVLLALAILLIALAAIGQLVDIGGDRGLEARYHVRGTRLALAKLAECEAGVIDLKGGTSGTFDEEPDWTWTVDSAPEAATNLYKVTVTVGRDYRGRQFEIKLGQMIYDPAAMGSSAQASKPTQADVDAAEVNGGNGNPTTGTMP
jgi:general secretion pathway protein I